MPSRNQPQPNDEWDFVPQDDEVETDEPVTASAETAAIHVERAGTPAQDAARADVALGDGTEGRDSNYADEEPENGQAQLVEREGETEPDLEEMLESQHYAFGPDE